MGDWHEQTVGIGTTDVSTMSILYQLICTCPYFITPVRSFPTSVGSTSYFSKHNYLECDPFKVIPLLKAVEDNNLL